MDKNQRNEFKDSLNIMNFENKNRKDDGLKVNDMRRVKQYTAPKGTMEKARKAPKQKRSFKKKISRGVKAIGLTAVLLTGAGLVHHSDDIRTEIENFNRGDKITLNEALKVNSAEELGLRKDLIQEKEEIEKLIKHQDKLSDMQLQDLAERINDLQFDIMDSKIANEFGVNPEQVSVIPEAYDSNGTITQKAAILIDNEVATKDLSDNMKAYIQDSENMRINSEQADEYSRSELLKIYEKYMNRLDKMSAKDFNLDKKTKEFKTLDNEEKTVSKDDGEER